MGIGDINEPGKPKTAPTQAGESLTAMTAVQSTETITEPSSTPTITSPDTKKETIHIEKDVELERVQKILKKTHDLYYENRSDPHKGIADVRIILPDLRKNILSGVRLVFSGVIPLGNDPKK